MTLVITLARLSRRIYLVARLHRLGYVTEKYIDEEGLGRRCKGTKQALGQSFKLFIIISLNVQVVNSVLHASFFLSI